MIQVDPPGAQPSPAICSVAGRAWASAWASSPRTRPSNEVCRARPCGTNALAATQGCTRSGASAMLSRSRGEPTRISGSGGSGPPASRSIALRSGRSASAVPRWCSTMSSTATPQRSAAAIALPALVPTMRSTVPTGYGHRCCSAARAPAIQAAPSTPPVRRRGVATLSAMVSSLRSHTIMTVRIPAVQHRPRSRSGAPAPTRQSALLPFAGHAGRLANLDQMAVGVAHVAADLSAVVLGLGEELRPPRAPRLIGGLDVGDTDVQEGAGAVEVARRLEDDLWLVVGRPAADVDDHPAVGQLDDRGLAVQHHLAAEHADIEVPRACDVRGDDEVGEDESLLWSRKVITFHGLSPYLAARRRAKGLSPTLLLRALLQAVQPQLMTLVHGLGDRR